MVLQAYVDGQEGTTGLRIHEYLSARDDVQVLRIDAHRRKDPAERRRLLNAADVAFLCLPDAASREAVSMVENPQTCVIDASTAHRVAPGWAYGLPELSRSQRDAIRGSKRIGNPGCHATAFILLVRPLVDAGLVEENAVVQAFSLTGYSGGGRRMIEHYEAGSDPRLSSPRQYALGFGHKHLPEMQAHSRLRHAPLFSPIVGNWYKGLSVTVGLPLGLLKAGTDLSRVQAALEAHYDGERFVKVRPSNDPETLEQGAFDVQACNGTNRVDVFAFGNEAARRLDGRPRTAGSLTQSELAAGDEPQVMLIARLDNLGKGASGAAIQAMNLHFGLDEATGLEEATGRGEATGRAEAARLDVAAGRGEPARLV